MLKYPILVLFQEFLAERLVLVLAFFFLFLVLDKNLLPQRLGWGRNLGIFQ